MFWLVKTFLNVGATLFLATYVCYIVVMLADHALTRHTNPVARAAIYAVGVPFALVGWPLDVVFNWTYGLALGVTDHLTLSGKLKHIRETHESGYRLAVSHFICRRLLNPFDRSPGGHC